MARPHELRKYDFRYEDTTNSVVVDVYLPREDFEEDILMQHAGRNGLEAGTMFRVQIMAKDRSEVYAKRMFTLQTARETPGVKNNWGETSKATKSFKLFHDTDWVVMTEDTIIPEAPRDAPREVETPTRSMTWNLGKQMYSIEEDGVHAAWVRDKIMAQETVTGLRPIPVDA